MPKPHTTDAYERRYHQIHEPRYLIVKGNKLVQDSHMLMPLEDQKVLASLVRSIKPNQSNLSVEFSTKQFMDMLGMHHTHTNAQNVIGALNNIMNDNFMMKNSDGTYDSIIWLHHVHADPRGKGYYRVDFNPDLSGYLFNQSMKYRTIYKFSDVMLMNSQYSPRLYEYFVSNRSRQRYQKRGVDYSIKELRLALNLVYRDKSGKIRHDKNGRIKYKYPRYSDFKRRVLKPAEKEINENTEYDIKLTTIRKSRKPVKLNVVMKRKNKAELRKRDDRIFFKTHHIPKSQWVTWKENVERGTFHKVKPRKKEVHKKVVNGQYKIIKPAQGASIDSSDDVTKRSLEKLDEILGKHKVPFKTVNMGGDRVEYYNPWMKKYVWTTRDFRTQQLKVYYKQKEYKNKQNEMVKAIKDQEKKRKQDYKR